MWKYGMIFLAAAACFSLPTAALADWTPWLNRDQPSGKGDYETLADFLEAGQACTCPLDIECQTADGQDWRETGQVYTCSRTQGGICVNDRQTDGRRCLDYRVRFFCASEPITVSADAELFYGCDRFGGISTRVTIDAEGGAQPYTCYGPAANFPASATGNQCVGIGTPPGTHTFVVADSSGNSQGVSVEINDVIETVVTFTKPSCCGCDDGSATASATGANQAAGFTYRWQPSDQTGASVDDLVGGTYSVTVTDTEGCFRVVEVTIPDGC